MTEDRPEGSLQYMLQDIELRHVSIIALFFVAGIGGYIFGRWPEMETIPEVAQVYLYFGLAFGIAMAAALAHVRQKDD